MPPSRYCISLPNESPMSFKPNFTENFTVQIYVQVILDIALCSAYLSHLYCIILVCTVLTDVYKFSNQNAYLQFHVLMSTN